MNRDGLVKARRGSCKVGTVGLGMKETTLNTLLRHIHNAPLFGREAEMSVLRSAYASVAGEKKTRIVSVIGPAGIGKSRLVHDFLQGIRGGADGAKGVSGPSLLAKTAASVPRVVRGSARDTTLSLGVFMRLLRARFGMIEGMTSEILKTQIRAQVTSVIGDRKVSDVAYFLGQFLGLHFEESPLIRAVADDPRVRRDLRSAVLKSFLEADAAHGPLCLVFEDLHFAHEDSLDLLRYLLEYLHGPILILCVARPELLLRYEDWPRFGERRHDVISLAVLSEDDSAAMMKCLLSPCAVDGQVPRALVDTALSFAGGNPQLLEQMVRIYKEQGVLTEEDDFSEQTRFRVHLDKLASARLPITVEDAIDARLAGLGPDEKQLLEQAAAMGSVFWGDAFLVLGRIGKEAPPFWSDGLDKERDRISTILESLIERDYILKVPDSTFAGSDEYVFKHNKERETIQRRTPQSMARRYHHTLADWMDSLPEVHASEEYVAILAGHWEKARQEVLSGLSYVEAGDVARSRYANAKAAEHYAKGILYLGDAHTDRRLSALHNYGDVLLILGRVDEALAAFRQMLTLAYRLDRKSKGGAAHNRIGRVYRDMGALDDASAHLTMAMRLFQEVGDERGVASSYDDIGKLYWIRGEYDQALTYLREGLSQRRRLADRRSIALSLNNVGLVLQDSGEFKQALVQLEQALSIRREIGDLTGIAQSLNNIGDVALYQGDYARALSLFQEALDIARQMGDRNRIALVLINIGLTYCRMDNAAGAISVLTQAEELCDALGDTIGLAETLRGLGNAYLLQGDLEKAKNAIGRAVDLFAKVKSKVHLASALRTLGQIAASGGFGEGQRKKAREYFSQSAAIFEETRNEAELAATFRAYVQFLRTDPESAGDPNTAAEAEQMSERAEAIFARIKISASGMDGSAFYGRGVQEK